MCKLGCCGTFTVVVNDFSGQVLVIKCWFLSITATMTPDSWQLLLAKNCSTALGTKAIISVPHFPPLPSPVRECTAAFPTTPSERLFALWCSGFAFRALLLVIRLPKPTTVSPTTLRPSCFTSGICAFVIVPTSNAISVRAPLSKHRMISLPRQLLTCIIQPPLIRCLPSRVIGTCCLGTLSIFQCCLRSRNLSPRLSSWQRGAPRCLSATFGLSTAAVSQKRSTLRTERP